MDDITPDHVRFLGARSLTFAMPCTRAPCPNEARRRKPPLAHLSLRSTYLSRASVLSRYHTSSPRPPGAAGGHTLSQGATGRARHTRPKSGAAHARPSCAMPCTRHSHEGRPPRAHTSIAHTNTRAWCKAGAPSVESSRGGRADRRRRRAYHAPPIPRHAHARKHHTASSGPTTKDNNSNHSELTLEKEEIPRVKA